MVDLEKELVEQRAIIASLEAYQHVQSRCITQNDNWVLALEHNSTAMSERVKALEHLKK